jgi:hypothetical protein
MVSLALILPKKWSLVTLAPPYLSGFNQLSALLGVDEHRVRKLNTAVILMVRYEVFLLGRLRLFK